MKKIKREIKGITLVALVVTIIVLLILAGVAIILTIGDNGLIGRAIRAKEEYIKAKEDEEKRLRNIYSSIQVADNDNAEITINMKELQTIIDERLNEKIDTEIQEKMLTGITGVNNNSLLLSSSNSSLSSGEIRLSNFTNKFTEGEFDKYFEYDGTSGNLICKQAGWYFIDLQLLIQDSREEYAQTILECMINNSLTTRVQGLVWTAEKQKRASDDNAFSIYLKEKDTITIKKVTYNNLALYNQVTINLYKM